MNSLLLSTALAAFMITAGLTVYASDTAAQNYFVDGTTWLSHVESSYLPDPRESDVLISLDGETEIAGHRAARLWEDYSDGNGRRLVTYIRTEGEKVFFLADEATADWRLMYDFSLQPGETARIWRIDGTIEYAITPKEHIVRCIEIRRGESAPAINEMLLVDTELEQTGATGSEGYGIIWLQGLGNNGNPLYNDYCDAVAGLRCELLEATDGSGILYRSEGYAAIDAADCIDEGISVRTGEIAVPDSESRGSRVYTVDGKRLRNDGGLFRNLPKGIYIVVAGGKATRVPVP